jgi:hypothetical protein
MVSIFASYQSRVCSGALVRQGYSDSLPVLKYRIAWLGRVVNEIQNEGRDIGRKIRTAGAEISYL